MPPKGFKKPKPVTVEDYQDALDIVSAIRQCVRVLERRFPMSRAVIGLEGSADAAVREFSRLGNATLTGESMSVVSRDADRPGEERS